MKPTITFFTGMLQVLAALLLATASLTAHAQANAIESINVSPASGGARCSACGRRWAHRGRRST